MTVTVQAYSQSQRFQTQAQVETSTVLAETVLVGRCRKWPFWKINRRNEAMEKQEAQRRLAELREQIRYHSRKYYTEDDPEISDFEYDQLYRQLETLEGEYPELVTADSPTQKIGGAVYNTFAEVVHQVPLESLHDSFSQEELRDFDRRVREAVGDVEYVAEPKFDGLSVALEYRDGLFVRGSTRGTASPARM